MSTSDLLGIIGVIVGIASLVYAVWTSMRSKLERHELIEFIRGIHAITGRGLLETSQSLIGASEKALGVMIAIRELTKKYSEHPQDIDLPDLIGKVLWSDRMISNYEVSPNITEIWLVTPDLKPDSSDEPTGKIVHKNLMEQKNYIYFYPDDLPHKESEIARLKGNILLVNPANTEIWNRVTLVALNRSKHAKLFYRGNIILYFTNRTFPPTCFEEVAFTKISKRGIFWQEHSEEFANELKHKLELELPRK